MGERGASARGPGGISLVKVGFRRSKREFAGLSRDGTSPVSQGRCVSEVVMYMGGLKW